MSVRERILDATAQIASEAGVAHLTLERVAEKSGVSNGGLLYHFASKDALLKAVIDHEADKFDAAVDRLMGAGMPLLEAYVEASCSTHRRIAGLAASFLAAAALDRTLLAPYQARCEAWRERLRADGVPADAVRAAKLMGDGLLVGSALGLVALSADELASVKRHMLWLMRPRYEVELLRTAEAALAFGT